MNVKRESGKVTEEMLKSFMDAFNRHDLDEIMSFFAEDCSFDMPRGHNAFGARFVGKPAVREGLASRFRGIPDLHYGDDSHFVSVTGERGPSEWLLTGTRTDGERVQVRGCDLLSSIIMGR